MSCCNTSKLSDRICETSGLDNVPLKGKKERKNNALQKSLGLTSNAEDECWRQKRKEEADNNL